MSCTRCSQAGQAVGAARPALAGIPLGVTVTPAEARALMSAQPVERLVQDVVADAMHQVPTDAELVTEPAQRFIAGRVVFVLRRFGLLP
ncbi:hypothetical protein [Salinarimonas soli]|uniref:Uncharacterized protein n=1 Tax=Salinarimonas soli TaxID=1638099 RepID=A0A5B2VGK3_9HYPH|nr:hypothetical protein [Salinarimonas soli]KAA2237686.1 hypothetical protein F0L46_08380 [Salinarimonas soli]